MVKVSMESNIKLPDAIIWATAQVHHRLLVTRNSKDCAPTHPDDHAAPAQGSVTRVLLEALAPVHPCTASEALFFIDRHALMGRGIGYVDVHLLAAAQLFGAQLWTRDKRLRSVATELGLSFTETSHRKWECGWHESAFTQAGLYAAHCQGRTRGG